MTLSWILLAAAVALLTTSAVLSVRRRGRAERQGAGVGLTIWLAIGTSLFVIASSLVNLSHR